MSIFFIRCSRLSRINLHDKLRFKRCTEVWRRRHLSSTVRSVCDRVLKERPVFCSALNTFSLDSLSYNTRTYSTNNGHELTENLYEKYADRILDALSDTFEDIGETLECKPEYDVAYSSGVLTVTISQDCGTYVINKQTPNKQIWLSSPLSGPKRYDYMDGQWIYKHDGKTLQSLLNTEISDAFKQEVHFEDLFDDDGT